MTQDPRVEVNFTVDSGVTVTVTVGSVKTACLSDAAFGGRVLVGTPLDPDVYNFTVTGASGDQERFACVCHFNPRDPADAHYTVTVTSDDGSGPFKLIGVYKEAPEASFVLFFHIR